MTTKMELLKRDLVKLANHLDQIGHRDLADRIDATIAKKAGWRDFTPDFLETSVDYWSDNAPSDVLSDLGEAASYTAKGAGNLLGAGADVITDTVSYPVQEAVNVYDTVMGGMALTEEEAYERQKRIDDRDYGTDWGDFDKGMDYLGRGAGLGVGTVGNALQNSPLNIAGNVAAIPGEAYEAMKLDILSDVPNTSGQRAVESIQRRSEDADIRQVESDRATAELAHEDQRALDEQAELQASQLAQDEAASGRNEAPSVVRSWGTEYYDQAPKAKVRELQALVGTRVDGQFGDNSRGAWTSQMNMPLPASIDEAITLAKAKLAHMRQNYLKKSASLEDRMTMLSNAFTSGVPANVRR